MEHNNKPITLDDLAVMVDEGFSDVTSRMGTLESRMSELEHRMDALYSTVNNYLELSEKRYFELKQRDALLAQWLKLIAEKTNFAIDVSQLEKI